MSTRKWWKIFLLVSLVATVFSSGGEETVLRSTDDMVTSLHVDVYAYNTYAYSYIHSYIYLLIYAHHVLLQMKYGVSLGSPGVGKVKRQGGSYEPIRITPYYDASVHT